MSTSLGLDIGTNSVGSAWIDEKEKTFELGVSVFPAGVEEDDRKRGTPKNQTRRSKRSQRRSIRRRSQRKARLRETLTQVGLLPSDPEEMRAIFGPCRNSAEKEVFSLEAKWNPWHLRRAGLERELTPFELGRILVHLNQRRGSLGVDFDETEEGNDSDSGAVKRAYHNLKEALLVRYAASEDQRKELEDDDVFQAWLKERGITIGRFMADEYDDRIAVANEADKLANKSAQYRTPLRNKRDMLLSNDGRALHAHRALTLDEFNRLWEKQKSYQSELSKLLTDELYARLCDQDAKETWRVQGDIFGQRNTYWDTGTLGRCDLEPSDHQCPIGDKDAQEFLVLETVNRIKVEWRGENTRFLNDEQRKRVIETLSKQKTATYATIRKALDFHKKEIKGFVSLNIEREQRIDLNTNWFAREVIALFGNDRWNAMNSQEQNSVNRAFLKIKSAAVLAENAVKWWGVDQDTAEALSEAWKRRPNPSKRLKLSRKAIRNLLPYMRGEVDGHYMGVTEARQAFSSDPNSGASELQRERYGLLGKSLTAADRQYLAKHTNSLPPAPVLSNPVVRKTIHEVRRHVNAYLRKHGSPPDRIVVELARDAKTPALLRNKQLAANRNREKESRKIIADFGLNGIRKNQKFKAVRRVKLCIEQRNLCAYCGETISPRCAANGQTDDGQRLEVDHIIPKSRSQNNSFNNSLICHARCNQDKGSKTPKEWLSPEEFEKLKQRLEHLSNGKYKTNLDGYDCKGNPSKWKNLLRDVHSLDDEEAMDEWRNSQLTDTSYASRQVVAYLRDALYSGDEAGKRRVFATNGKYTARLRRDWGLVEENLDRQWHGWKLQEKDDKGKARNDEKDRGDHRHHAVDAVAIALSPKYISRIAQLAAQWEEYKAGKCSKPAYDRQPAPWGDEDGGFRRQVVEKLEELIVSHRPQNRRIVGALHKETGYGIATEFPGLYTERISIEKLKSSHFTRPEPVMRGGEIKRWKIPGRGQGRAIRDPQLCIDLEACLRKHALNPTNFKESDIKKLINFSEHNKHKIRMPSGVPIYSFIGLLALSDPVRIVGSDGVERYFVGGNNHHMEVLEDIETGKWTSHCWDMFTVAGRARPKHGELKLPLVIGRQLEQLQGEEQLPKDIQEVYENKSFVMSLAIGETFFLKHKETGEPGYFVVYKLDDKDAYFHAHWDGRPATGSNKREFFQLSAIQLQAAIIDPGKVKVAVDPLGQMRPLNND